MSALFKGQKTLNDFSYISVGIDIGLNSCKMIEVKKTESGLELVSWGIEKFAGGNAQLAVKQLLDILSEPDVAPRTAISGKGTLIRYIEMLKMAPEELKKSFVFEADKYLPFPIDQIYLDCFILNKHVGDNKMSVLVAAAKKELVDERIDLLSSMSLQPDFITLNALAIANVFNVLGVSTDEGGADGVEKQTHAMAVLDIGEEVSNLTIIVDGLPAFSRDIFVGGREFTKSISNALGIPFDEAENLKQNAGERREKVLEASESVVLNLISELRLSLDYFVTEKNIAIAELYLTGGASTLEGITDSFAKYLEITVKDWNPL
ncbi:MAG: type IV pilus assembly protein PilM, partial [Candidatus Omnitrophica bacterium]|nr:type IV pilus assembly protein PilM [Candidatus Omnitrophota bacterium]